MYLFGAFLVLTMALAADVKGPALDGLVALLVLVPWVWHSARKPGEAAAFLVAVIAFGEEALSLAYRMGVPAEIVRALIASKDLLAWGLLLTLVAKARTARAELMTLKVATFLGVVAVVFVLHHSAVPMSAQVGEMRAAVVPMLALSIGALLPLDAKRKCASLAVPIITVAAALSLLQLALPASALRSTIGVGNYWSAVKNQPLLLSPSTGLPANFFTSSGFPRLTGCFGDPLSAGEILGAGLVLAGAYRSMLRRPTLQMVILSVALLLTFTRDGWIYALVGIAVLTYQRYGLPRVMSRLIAGLVVAVACIYLVHPINEYVLGIIGGTDSSTGEHAISLAQSFSYHFSVTGYGWGTSGTFAGQSYSAAVEAESVYTDMLEQGGYVFAAALIGCLGWVALDVLRERTVMRPLVWALLLTQVWSGFVSENAIAFNSGFVPFLVIGLITAAPTAIRPPPRLEHHDFQTEMAVRIDVRCHHPLRV
jgi:hypothetical protein